MAVVITPNQLVDLEGQGFIIGYTVDNAPHCRRCMWARLGTRGIIRDMTEHDRLRVISVHDPRANQELRCWQCQTPLATRSSSTLHDRA